MDPREEELVRELYPALRRIAGVAGPVDVEPDDLVQEALVRTLSRRSIADLENPLAYLRRAILNLASNQRRSAARRRTALARHGPQAEITPSYPADVEALIDLPPRQKAILYLVEVERVPYAEAAEQLGMTAASARSTARRARAKARLALEVGDG